MVRAVYCQATDKPLNQSVSFVLTLRDNEEGQWSVDLGILILLQSEINTPHPKTLSSTVKIKMCFDSAVCQQHWPDVVHQDL